LLQKPKGYQLLKIYLNLTKKKVQDLEWGSKILNLMGIKTITTKDSIKIYGNPNLKLKKKLLLKII
jgi:3-phosphoshikimate 1-carboxyvinyltransferase